MLLLKSLFGCMLTGLLKCWRRALLTERLQPEGRTDVKYIHIAAHAVQLLNSWLAGKGTLGQVPSKHTNWHVST